MSVAALHTQDETGRSVVMEAGGDFLLTVKNNQPTLRANVAKKLPAPAAGFPPEEPTPLKLAHQNRTKDVRKSVPFTPHRSAQRTSASPSQRKGRDSCAKPKAARMKKSYCQQPFHEMASRATPSRPRHHHRFSNTHGGGSSHHCSPIPVGQAPFPQISLMNWSCEKRLFRHFLLTVRTSSRRFSPLVMRPRC